MMRKIAQLRKMIDDAKLSIDISVDGNVNAATIPEMVGAGANILVLGSSGLFRKDISLKEAVQQIHHSIDLGLQKKEELLCRTG
jgi:D-allulose-6-phosphate 3-epimerase